MLAKRIVPCLDIKDGQTVKGTNFVNLRQAGDPVELGRAYSEQGDVYKRQLISYQRPVIHADSRFNF